MGLSTPVPEGGKCFSTNQVEKISLAMNICRKPKVLLVEDTLSSFDNSQLKNLIEYLKGKEITLISYESELDEERIAIYDNCLNI